MKKRLPKDFEAIVESGDLAAMKEVFNTHSVDAYGPSKTPALATYAIPAELIRWLIEQGADIEQGDAYGETPLHHHARAWNGHPAELIALGANVESRDDRDQTPLFGARRHLANVRTLLDARAHVHALDDEGRTPLEYWLETSGTGDLTELAQTVPLLLGAGAEVSQRARESIGELSADFARIREAYNPESLGGADAAIASLCEIAGIAPAIPAPRHDGVSPISVRAVDWTEQYDELFSLLVPPAGQAPNAQGEMLRIATRVLNEIEGNGSINWDNDFRAMVDSVPDLLRTGSPLESAHESRLSTVLRTLRTGRAPEGEAHELVRFAVTWVIANPIPIPLTAMPYRR